MTWRQDADQPPIVAFCAFIRTRRYRRDTSCRRAIMATANPIRMQALHRGGGALRPGRACLDGMDGQRVPGEPHPARLPRSWRQAPPRGAPTNVRVLPQQRRLPVSGACLVPPLARERPARGLAWQTARDGVRPQRPWPRAARTGGHALPPRQPQPLPKAGLVPFLAAGEPAAGLARQMAPDGVFRRRRLPGMASGTDGTPTRGPTSPDRSAGTRTPCSPAPHHATDSGCTSAHAVSPLQPCRCSGRWPVPVRPEWWPSARARSPHIPSPCRLRHAT